MITHEDLQAAIAECLGVRNPTAQTCIKLAAFYTIQEHLYGVKPDIYAGYSGSAESGTVSAFSESEFSAAIDGMQLSDMLAVMDELMQAVQVLNPRLYAATLRKLEQ